MSDLVEEVFRIEGMTCSGCEMRIESMVKKIPGVEAAAADFASSRLKVTYDPQRVSGAAIIQAVETLDYQAVTTEPDKTGGTRFSISQFFGLGIVVIALYLLIVNTVGFTFLPRIEQSMSYGLLFAVGLMTSLHCLAMCGGITISQSMTAKSLPDGRKMTKFKPGLLYNAGRVISYTTVGGLAGALGSAVSFSGPAKGMVAILSGLLMVVMGLNMLDIFPWLKRINPRLPKIFGSKIYRSGRKYGPFYIGLFSALMPCGPLQAMQLYALGTGGFIPGALAMLFFSLGTVPLVFGLGAASAFFSSRFTRPMIKVSMVLVIVLGMIMVNRGLNLSGASISMAGPSLDLSAQAAAPGMNIARISGEVQTVTTTMASGQYTPFVVQKGIPLQWTIQAAAADLNGCNNPLTIPSLHRQIKLVPGSNLITFTPERSGTIIYTCWMGMISSKITVVADLGQLSAALEQKPAAPETGGKSSGSCCAVD